LLRLHPNIEYAQITDPSLGAGDQDRDQMRR
jgi:hypothetical protein